MKRLICLLLTTALLLSLLPAIGAADAVQAGDSFTYTTADSWGINDGIWSWQWAAADKTSFADMTFTTVDGQGEVYAADWELYPYCAARKGGINIHPNAKADAARVFTAPASGWVTITATVARQTEFTTPATCTPTSFRILLEETTVYPSTGDYRILTSTTPEVLTASVFVKAGEHLRFVVGAMDNQTSDSVNLQTTVTYDTVETPTGEVRRIGESFHYEKTADTFGSDDALWSWEWALAGETAFSPMTYQLVEKYSQYMYASDWATHPYNYVSNLGVKLHPASTADTVKTFTVPFTGTVKLDTEVARYVNLSDATSSSANGTSLRILVNDTQVYPLYKSYLTLDSTTAKNFSVSLSVTEGDKIRIVIGSIGQENSDAVEMYNTVTYTSLETPEICVSDKETFSASETQWAENDMGNWSFEWRDSDDTFGDMTYQYVETYSKYMYASDWTNHKYNYVDQLGVKLHPAKTRDVVKTYTAPYDGRIQMSVTVARIFEYTEDSGYTPTSLRIYKNDEQIWPTNGGEKELTSTTASTYNISADVRAGDKIRCVVGSMSNTTQDGIQMYNTVTYRAVGLRELAAFMDQYNQRIDVIDVQGDNLDSAETAWSWMPTTALGFTDLTTFNSPTDAKIRYSSSLKKYVVAVCSSRGFMGVVDMATGKKIWQVSLVSDSSNPHAIEYLPNGNVAVAGSIGDWVRIYTSSQGSSSSTYTEVTLEGAHGVLWDPNHNILWCLGTYDIKAYRIGGTAASPTLTELTQYHATLTEDIKSGHDLSPVYGNPDRLWISSRTVLQYDIPTASFVTDYEGAEVIARNTIKGISSFPDSHTIVHVFPNETYLAHDSDRIFVTLPEDGVYYGRTHSHSTGAYYKVRSWISSYNYTHTTHRSESTQAVAATCTTTGLTEGSHCSICNAVLVAQETIPATGHCYTSEVTVSATCTTAGVKTYTCSNCSDSYTEAISATGHTVVTDAAVAATCTTTGLTEGSHCSVCSAVLVAQETIPAIGHNYVRKMTVSPTCSRTGAKIYTCSNCSDSYTETIPATGHTAVTDAAVAATCTTTGLTEGSHCSVCSAVLVAQETIPATGHSYTSQVTVSATCTTAGVKTYTCSNCSDSYTEAISATGHTVVTDAAVAATCTTTGLTEGSHCSVCSAVLVAQETIPATGHAYSYTDNGDGTHTGICSRCDKPLTEAHEFTDGTCSCGAVELTVDESVKIYHALNLASDISISFVVPQTALADYDSYYMEVVLPEYEGNEQIGTSTVQIQPVVNGNYYYFTLTGITAVRMGDLVEATLHMTRGTANYISATDTYSVATYAYAMLNSTTDTYMQTLCADLLRYGAEAQSYKGYRTDALVDADMTETHRGYLSDTENLTFTATDSYLGDLDNATVTWLGKTLDLGSKVGMKFVFSTQNYTGDISALSMVVSYTGSNGEAKTVTLTGAEAYGTSGNYYSFTFYGLLASELRTVVDVAVYEGETRLSETLRYSAESYAAKNTTGTLALLCNALFAYSDSAKAYFAN